MRAVSAYDKRRAKRDAQRERALAGETLAAFHAREKAPPPTLAEIFAKNRADKARCAKTPDHLAEVRRLYVETDMPNNVIGERYGKAPNWVNNLATKHGWPIRKFAKADSPKPTRLSGSRATTTRGPKPRTLKQITLDRRAEAAVRDRELYGDDLDDINLLRACGFVVNREGSSIRVGNTLCTFAEMRDKAARERRLRKATA